MTAVPKKVRKTQRSGDARTQSQNPRRTPSGDSCNRVENHQGPEYKEPMMTASNIHYDSRTHVPGLSAGGFGTVRLLARRTRLIGDVRPRSSIYSSGVAALSRIRPCPEYRLRRPGRRPDRRASRTAAEDDEVSLRRPRHRASPRPHRGRGFLQALTPAQHIYF